MPNSVITLTIEKAEALLALNPGGTSNPYMTATIGAQSVTTTVQNKTVNPVFNATFTFQDCPLPSIVTLRVFNKIQYVDVEDPLGTATVTIFDTQPEETTKMLQLSHGGNAALAQRAPNGCGSVTIRYSATAMPEAQPQQQPSIGVSKNNSITSASGHSTPMPVPAAVNIDGSSPAAIPVAITPKDSHVSTPRAGVQASGSLVASNPSVTNPAATTPKLKPVEVSANASEVNQPAVAPVYASSAAFGLTNTQNSQLTPPSLSPARPPAVATFLVPQVAPAPPTTATLSMPVKAAGNASSNGYVSYSVPGVRMPVAVEEQPLRVQGSADFFYANNSALQPASTPLPAMQAPSLSSASMLPVAPNAPAATHYASLQESTNPATSFDAQQQQRSVSASSLYTSAAQAPSPFAQQRLLVVPPNINGTPTPTLFHASAAPSQEGSRLPSAAQLPTSMTATSEAFPAYAPPAPYAEAGAIPVAVAPRTQPLSSSTSNSLRSTPATLSSHGRPAGNGSMSGFPAHTPVSSTAAAAVAGAASAAGARRAVALAPATAGLQQSAGAAFPSPPHPSRMSTATVASVHGTTSPKRRSPKNEVSGTTGDAAAPSAEELYADKEYLFEAAASGSDEAIFHQLRVADPCLTNGFLSCVDYSGRSLLHIAAWNGQLRVLQILLAPEPAAPMIDLHALIAAKSGNTILHAAACSGQAEVAQWLRYSHPTAGPLLLSVRNVRGMTAAECAMEAGFPQVARLLIPN